MLQGVYTAVRKDGTIYYRSNITYKSKHISLGSFDSELSASRAYATASTILLKETNSIEDSYFHTHALAFDKIVTLINFRDNGMYIKTPIYLRKNYFSYYLDISHELKFDIDDLYAGGVLKYGLCQADKYYDGLIERFEFLTENSNIGLNSDELAPNLQRFPYGRHVIFFTNTDTGVMIVRVLGEEMDFERHIGIF